MKRIMLVVGAMSAVLLIGCASERAAIGYAQAFANLGNVSDATFAALNAHFSERQITDITLIAAYFVALGSIMNAFRVELEPESTLAQRKEREG